MIIQVPDSIHNLLDEFVGSFCAVLGERLTGIYLHGSLAMGCFNPASSDVDLLVVVREPLPPEVKIDLGRRLLRLAELAPAYGIEMSVVTRQSLLSFRHPSPYELHFSPANQACYTAGEVDFSGEMLDPDLAAHFTITRTRGVCLYGESVEKVFPPIPSATYLDSIAGDAAWSYENIRRGPDEGMCRVPTYGVLNFCRVLAYIAEGLITSKREGGEWGVRHLSVEYAPLIQAALDEYEQSGSAPEVDGRLLKRFAVDAIQIIDSSLASQGEKKINDHKERSEMNDILSEERFDFISGENKQFINAFNDEMTRLGYEFGNKIGSGFCWGKYMIIYTKAGVRSKNAYARIYIREGSIVLRLYLNGIDKHREFIEKTPAYIKEVFTGEQGKCHHDRVEKDGSCRFRKSYTIDGQLIEKCNGVTFEFHEPTLQKMSDYISLFTEFYPIRKARKP